MINRLTLAVLVWLAIGLFPVAAQFPGNVPNNTFLGNTTGAAAPVRPVPMVPITGTPSVGNVPIASSGTAAAWGALTGAGNIVVGSALTGTCTNGQGVYNNNGVVGCTTFAGGGGFTVGSAITGTCGNGSVVFNNAGNIGCQTLAGGGNVIASGTPTAQQIPLWLDAAHINGVINPAAVQACSINNQQPTGPQPTSYLSYGINVDGMATGTVGANTISPGNFLNAADTVVSNTFWSTTAQKYLVAQTAGNFVAQSAYCSRDQEVTSWTQNGYAYLRYANGSAIYFLHNRSIGQLTIGVVQNIVPGVFGSGKTFQFYSNSNLPATFPGYSTTGDTTNNTLTFGVSGYNVYVKFNGVVGISLTMGPWALMNTGSVVLTALDNSATGWRNVTVSHLPTQALYGDPGSAVFDVRDFGARETPHSALFTASVTGTTMNVTLISKGTLYPGMILKTNAGSVGTVGTDLVLNDGTQIVSQIDGTPGGVGNYVISPEQNFPANPILGWYGIATGTMTGGSNSLVLSNSTYLKVGDFVIVQCGTETGKCIRGTAGVGGQWPAKNYATVTALKADTTQAANTIAWASDTGDVWQFTSFQGYISNGSGAAGTTLVITSVVSSNAKIVQGDVILSGASAGTTITVSPNGTVGSYTGTYTVNNSQLVGSAAAPATFTLWSPVTVPKYYVSKAIPSSLHAQITAISADGLTLTLSQAAVVGATNAAVYLDNTPFLNFLSYSYSNVFPAYDLGSITPRGSVINIPRGMFAMAGEMILQQQTGWTVRGQGRASTILFSPNAIHTTSLTVSGSPHSKIQDLALLGNNGQLNYMGLSMNMSYNNLPTTLIPNGYNANGSAAWSFTSSSPPLTQILIPGTFGITYGIELTGHSDNTVVQRVMATDFYEAAIGAFTCLNCWFEDAVVNLNADLQAYTQWQAIWTGSSGGGCIHCTFNMHSVTAALSMFGSSGVTFRDIVLNNGFAESNTSSNFSLADYFFNITNSFIPPAINPVGVALLNINNNAGHGAGGSNGVIKNINMFQTVRMNGIFTVTATGVLQTTTDFSMMGLLIGFGADNVRVIGGSYIAPDWVSTAVLADSATTGPTAFSCQAQNCIIDAFYSEGVTGGGHSIAILNPGSGIISNSVGYDVFCDPTINCTMALQAKMGTWTPALSGTTTAGAPTYTTRTGNYTISYFQAGAAVLRKIDVDFNLLTLTLGAPAGNMQISGLPVASIATANIVGTCALAQYSGWTGGAGYTSLGGTIQPNTSIIGLIASGSGQTAQATPVTNYAAATNLIGSCTYH